MAPWTIIGIFYIFLVVCLNAWWRTHNPDAKRLARLERRVSELSKQLGIEEAPLTEVQELVTQGRKINAIKLYREQTGVGLREAKEAVDDLEAQMKAQRLV